MAAQHQANGFSCRVRQQVIRVVGRMAQHNHRLMGHIANGPGDCRIGIGTARNRIVEPHQPDALAAALNGQIGIVEHGHAVGPEGLCDLFFSKKRVVIAEDGIALLAVKFAQNIGALPCRADCEFSRRNSIGDIVPGEEDSVGLQPVDALHRFAQKKWLRKFVQMDIGELGHPHAVEAARQAAQMHIALCNVDPVTLKPS